MWGCFIFLPQGGLEWNGKAVHPKSLTLLKAPIESVFQMTLILNERQHDSSTMSSTSAYQLSTENMERERKEADNQTLNRIQSRTHTHQWVFNLDDWTSLKKQNKKKQEKNFILIYLDMPVTFNLFFSRRECWKIFYQMHETHNKDPSEALFLEEKSQTLLFASCCVCVCVCLCLGLTISLT